jgi:hypothetical protein
MDGKLMSDHSTLDVGRPRAAGGPSTGIQAPRGSRIATQLGRFAGHAVGLLVFAALAVLEPFVRLILITVASLGMIVTIVFGFLIGAEGFPKWFMLAMSVSFFLLLAAYYGVMNIFGNVSDTRDLH